MQREGLQQVRKRTENQSQEGNNNSKERVIKMSDRNRTPEEYIKRHADQYHNGDIERAKKDAIVKEVLSTLEVE